jgi:PAS domain S-box-containing protein
LRDSARLNALRSTVLMDSPAEESFDRLTRLAARFLSVPVALVTLVDDERQFFKSCVGLPAAVVEQRSTPLSHSFCQYPVATGEPLIVRDAREDPVLRDNGALRDLSVIAYAGFPLVTSDGHPIGSFCVIDHKPRDWTAEEIDTLRDLTGAAITEIELRVTAARAEGREKELIALLESTDEGFFGIDVNGACTFINPAGATILGYEPAEVLGRNMHQLIHHTRSDGSPYPESDCPIFQVSRYAGGVRMDGELLWRKDGTSFPSSSSSRSIEVDGVHTGAVVAFRDITDRARVEHERSAHLQTEREARAQAEAAVALRDEVLAIVSHDLRNPLNTVLMSASLLLEMDLTPEQRTKQLEIVLRSARNMNGLIQDLLDVARIDAGRMRVQTRPQPVRPLVSEGVELLSHRAEQKQVALHCEINAEEVEADGPRVVQVLSNLVGNAIKFTPQGGAVRVSVRPDGDGLIRFEVSDTGIGIDPNDLPHLFDRFWQVQRTARGGAGLGLAISKGLVEAHGGQIWVDSELGAGSTFCFTLPAPVRTSAQVSAETGRGRPERQRA